MKKLVSIFSGLLVLTAGCKKENALKLQRDNLSGKWELTRSYSGWGGTTEYPSGNGNFILFEGNILSMYTQINDIPYTTRGTFNIYMDRPCDNAPETSLIEFHDFLSSSSYGTINEIVLSNGELSIGDTQCVADGGTNYYRKIQ
ncbi:MAG TPA: hypothetical protein PLA68_12230 [Panacibacter sp.]|nr:hypothetical protein [Panacibacter sp.]